MASRTILCVGDSNTRGQYGVDYVAPLAARLRSHDVTVTGAGVNGDCSANVLQRLDSIIKQRPSAVVILIGTNDIWSTLSEKNAGRMVRRKQLPAAPTLGVFRENLAAITRRLRAQTDARIALMSPPVLGQDIASRAGHTGQRFSVAVEEVAAAHDVSYLPLHERQCGYLAVSNAPTVPLPPGTLERILSVGDGDRSGYDQR
ncbi:SGNH/GDSL hydrolase family protein [Mycolicibacterium farcinogenes]|uniref:SGNH/GDSL hydrolase family protein n=1 Tax=Mycolicibacterium farcinogenes TaxID=1802 RepID=A0ACD1FQP6_MYCFR|nr:GDSL-type esterase/lipase family protein [Mycolicibacterium farcinogenes]QZH69395.1 SGNH/GDSL hydrolase family protein [Mycolicibacterium farcinogenes]